MAIEQTKKQSDLEKRLKLLRQQVYGKQELKVHSSEFRAKDKTTNNYQLPVSIYQSTQVTNSSSDVTYLYQDLFKILTFSSLAIGIQLVLFILTKNHLLNLKFF